MADSPKHLDCIRDGKTGQTYKVAGRREYKCSSCKKTLSASDFQPIEFEWRTKPSEWSAWYEEKLKNVA